MLPHSTEYTARALFEVDRWGRPLGFAYPMARVTCRLLRVMKPHSTPPPAEIPTLPILTSERCLVE